MKFRCQTMLFFSLVTLLDAFPVSAQTTVRVAVAGAQAASIPFNVGTRKGIFAKHGLNVEMISIANGQTAARAQLSGSVQLATSNAVGFFYLVQQGAESVGIASWNNSSPYSLASRVKIKDISGLKGKRLASSGAGGRSDAFIKFMMTKVGLDPRKDIQILSLTGGSAVRLAAVLAGSIDAALISYTQEKQAQKLGLTVIPISMEYIQGAITTQKPYLARNRNTVKAFLRGLAESVGAIRADKEGTISVIARVLKTDDRESLDHAYEVLRSQVVADLYPTEQSIDSVLKTMSYEDPVFGSIPPFKYFDLSLLQEVKAGQ
jgi:ABC-type nitrate/sulfonate/bicarbonate transport system substrate-binding protein